MGGLASKMPFSTVSGMIAALSIAGAPPLACFISEFFIFMGAFQVINGNINSFYVKVFLGTSPGELVEDAHSSHGVQTPAEHLTQGHKIVDVPNYMKAALAILVILVVIIGIYPTFFMNLIQTVTFGGAVIV
jgi:multicomponent Na+:H+ antiporter subunit D